jgi:hypothetical protein
MGLVSYIMDSEKRSSVEMSNRYHYDESEDKIIIERNQDIEPILSSNREKRNIDDGYTKDRTMKRVGRIPMVVVEKIIVEQGWNPMDQNNSDRLLQLLDDPEYAHFKTSDGKHARSTRREFFRGSTSSASAIKPVYSGGDD